MWLSSDHSPILLKTNEIRESSSRINIKRFESLWLEKRDLGFQVQQFWQVYVVGQGILSHTLNHLVCFFA